MAMTPEKKVKRKVVEILKKYGLYYFYPVSGGFGSSGVPDIVVCCEGRFVAIECKAGNKKPTALQQQNLTQIANNGGIAMVINEKNIERVENELLDIFNLSGRRV